MGTDIKLTTMKKLIIIIGAIFTLSSCTKEDYVYNHCYTLDKSKFGYASSSFFVGHELSEQEKKDWCYTLDLKVVDNQRRTNPNFKLEDIDTSYVYKIEKWD